MGLEAGATTGVEVYAEADDKPAKSCSTLAGSFRTPVLQRKAGVAERETHIHYRLDVVIQLEDYRGRPYYKGGWEAELASSHWREQMIGS